MKGIIQKIPQPIKNKIPPGIPFNQSKYSERNSLELF